MANSLITSSLITKEALATLHNQCQLIKACDTSYSSYYTSHGRVGKPGDTINVRKPTRGNVRDVWTMNIGDISEASVPVKIDQITGVDFSFSSAELSLTIEDFAKRYIKPNVELLAARIDSKIGTYMKNNIHHTVKVSSLGTAPDGLSYFLQARRKVLESLAPPNSLRSVLSPRTEASLVDKMQSLYHSSSNSEAVKRGEMVRTAGLSWYPTANLPMHKHGTCTTAGNVTAYSATTLTITGVTSSGTLLAGDVITITNCFAVNPETKEAYGESAQFVVTEDAEATGTNIVVSVSPSVVLTGPEQNIASTPVGKAAVLMQTTADQTVYNDLVVHPNAFALVFADLDTPGGIDMASKATMDGVTIRFLRDFNIISSEYKCRLDVLFGIKALRPEHACKIIS